jgi:hypothetical protein
MLVLKVAICVLGFVAMVQLARLITFFITPHDPGCTAKGPPKCARCGALLKK